MMIGGGSESKPQTRPQILSLTDDCLTVYALQGKQKKETCHSWHSLASRPRNNQTLSCIAERTDTIVYHRSYFRYPSPPSAVLVLNFLSSTIVDYPFLHSHLPSYENPCPLPLISFQYHQLCSIILQLVNTLTYLKDLGKRKQTWGGFILPTRVS